MKQMALGASPVWRAHKSAMRESGEEAEGRRKKPRRSGAKCLGDVRGLPPDAKASAFQMDDTGSGISDKPTDSNLSRVVRFAKRGLRTKKTPR